MHHERQVRHEARHRLQLDVQGQPSWFNIVLTFLEVTLEALAGGAMGAPAPLTRALAGTVAFS